MQNIFHLLPIILSEFFGWLPVFQRGRWNNLLLNFAFVDGESVHDRIIPGVAAVAVYCHLAAVYVHYAEIVGFGCIENIPGSADIRRDGAGGWACAAGAVEKLNYIVPPLNRGEDLGVGGNAAVDGLAGIEM